MPSLDSFGYGLDQLVDDYLALSSRKAAAAMIRAHPLLLTPVAARTVLAMNDDVTDVKGGRRAWLLYRAELGGLARALAEYADPTSTPDTVVDPEVRRALEAFEHSKSLDDGIGRLHRIVQLPGYADLDRQHRRVIDQKFGELMLRRYAEGSARSGDDLEEALVRLRRGFSAEPTIEGAQSLGEAELETFLWSGERQHLIRAHDLIEGVLNQQNPEDPARPLALVTFGRVQLAHHAADRDPDALASALLSAELAADMTTRRSVARKVMHLAREVQEAAPRRDRGTAAAAARIARDLASRLRDDPGR